MNKSASLVLVLAACDPIASAPTDGGAADAGSSDGGFSADREHPLVHLDDATLARLRGAMEAGTPAATRFCETVDAELAKDRPLSDLYPA